MRHVFASTVHTQERADQQHAGARGADDVGEHGAEAEQGGVACRRGSQVAAEHDASRDRVERAEEEDERDVLFHRVPQSDAAGLRIEAEQVDGRRDRQCPGHDRLVQVDMPPVAGDQRQQRHREQERGKRDDTRRVRGKRSRLGGRRRRRRDQQGRQRRSESAQARAPAAPALVFGEGFHGDSCPAYRRCKRQFSASVKTNSGSNGTRSTSLRGSIDES